MGRGLSQKQLAHDLIWGRRLQLVRRLTAVHSFRGKAKDKGFAGWLKRHNISRRQAYRLIARWEQMLKMMWNALEETRKLEAQVEKEYGNPKPPGHL